MRVAQPLEREVGIEYYASDSDGTGGELRRSPGDFRVREIEGFDTEPIDAPADAYPHLVVRVTLRDWDTNDFAGALSDRLAISRERVSWAGTKDKHAVTTQLFSIDGIDPAALPDVDGATCEVVGRAGRPILFGDLAGNAFEVVVRDPDTPERAADVTADLRAFAEGDLADDGTGVGVDRAGDSAVAGNNRIGDGAGTGTEPPDDVTVAVPNYFGHQRFGSRRPVTHEVGLAVLRENWERAVLAYVGNPSDREPERTREARAFVEETRDWQAALDRVPRYLGYERAMLHRLVEGENGPADFRAALESVPTNLQQLFVNAAQSYVFNRILSERLDRGLPVTEPVAGDVVCFADGDAPPDLPLPDQDRTQHVTADRVRAVTRHCDRGRAFVTAPLVGTETGFATGEPGEIERGVLDDLDLERTDFDLPGEFGSEGTRRAVLVRTGLSLSVEPLAVSFRLPRGSYATVLLREFLKTDPGEL